MRSEKSLKSVALIQEVLRALTTMNLTCRDGSAEEAAVFRRSGDAAAVVPGRASLSKYQLRTQVSTPTPYFYGVCTAPWSKGLAVFLYSFCLQGIRLFPSMCATGTTALLALDMDASRTRQGTGVRFCPSLSIWPHVLLRWSRCWSSNVQRIGLCHINKSTLTQKPPLSTQRPSSIAWIQNRNGYRN